MTGRDPDRPIDAGRYAWPGEAPDPVVRMRALAAALPHVAVDETVFDVPFERLWRFVADLEQSTPRFEGLVRHVRVLDREHGDEGERLVIEARAPLGGPTTRFDVVLRPGWCLMRSRLGEVGMAARPEAPGATRFVHFEGASIPGRILRPLFAWNIRQDFRRLRACLAEPTADA